MNYLHTRRVKQKKIRVILFLVLILFLIWHFRTPVYRFLSFSTHFVFSPISNIGISVSENFSNFFSAFESKIKLQKENQRLSDTIAEQYFQVLNNQVLTKENIALKEILNRTHSTDEYILGNILNKPTHSLYDTLIIDVGIEDDIAVGQIVFAFGYIPIGKVSEAFNHSAKVLLFSSPQEKTEAIISDSNIFVDLIGRGGGNFEIILPRDLALTKGQEIILTGNNPFVVAVMDSVITDARDAYQKAILKSPVNIQEIKFVQVKK